MHGCCSCKYLKEKDKKDGKVNGSVYLCTKTKKYVSGASNCCDAYSKDPLRKSYVTNEIYRNGKKFYNDKTEPGTYLVALIALIIFGLIITFIG